MTYSGAYQGGRLMSWELLPTIIPRVMQPDKVKRQSLLIHGKDNNATGDSQCGEPCALKSLRPYSKKGFCSLCPADLPTASARLLTNWMGN